MGHDLKTSASPMWRHSLLNYLDKEHYIVFNNISVEYNNTNIQCRATLSNGETEDSNNFTLLVQGEKKIIEDGGG